MSPPLHISIVVSRFPKFTETFVVNEILAFDRAGLDVEIHPLLSEEPPPHQPAAEPLVARARFGAPWGAGSLRALVRVASSRPARLARVVGRLLADTWRHPRFLLKDLVLVPRVCAVAIDVQRLGVEHVHAHFATHGGFAAWAVGRFTGVPYSIVAHGSDVHRHQHMLSTKVREAAFVATVSEYNRRVILAACDPDVADRVIVARSGVELPPPRHVSEGVSARSDPLVLCIGTLHEVKGQAVLVRAVAELARRDRVVRVEFLGDGPDRRMIETLAENSGVADRVRIVGAVPHEQVLAAYRRATLVAVPSVASRDGRKEGIPTVAIEAMASGVPVIASDLAGIPELVAHERTGLLVPPGDHHELAAAIERVLDDADLADDLCRRARAQVVEDYDLDRNAARMVERIAAATRVAGDPG